VNYKVYVTKNQHPVAAPKSRRPWLPAPLYPKNHIKVRQPLIKDPPLDCRVFGTPTLRPVNLLHRHGRKGNRRRPEHQEPCLRRPESASLLKGSNVSATPFMQ